jgi:hypothetical protein
MIMKFGRDAEAVYVAGLAKLVERAKARNDGSMSVKMRVAGGAGLLGCS